MPEDPHALEKSFRFKDFVEAMAFVNRVAALAEAEGHHPDIHISWNRVRLELTTPLDKDWNRQTEQGHADLKLWVETKELARREGRDPAQALRAIIAESKKRYGEAA